MCGATRCDVCDGVVFLFATVFWDLNTGSKGKEIMKTESLTLEKTLVRDVGEVHLRVAAASAVMTDLSYFGN